MRDLSVIRWSVHLASPREQVWTMIDTAEGRARFWAESAEERDGAIEFRFHAGPRWRSEIVERVPGEKLALRYFEGSLATFTLADADDGGTDVTITETGVPEDERLENFAGWVTVLLTLKAACDFGIDLRNRDPRRGWEAGFVDV
jgi:uncharacterized protein YndB with AHSA1/START domain